MAKILVADDNSNVQKTVTLALADLGIEVVAVNNGEAAVRKLVDVSPDLVLADIFMPVRNGYEVCEYVKKDARFSHVPVVLLVGAFDPLDEREAQRVGADGILKKPFVPPEPLIAMVKMLLDRTLGERLVAVEVAAKPAIAAARTKSGGVTAAEHPPSSAAAQISEEAPEEEFRPPVDRLSFGDGARPMAFGQLLEPPVEESAAPGAGMIEPLGDEQILTSARDASLGDPIFWKTEEPQREDASPENSEMETEPKSDIEASAPMRPWKPDEEAIARAAEAELVEPVEPFELVRDENEVNAGQASTIVESSPIMVQDPAAQAALTVDSGKLEDLAANPIEWMATVPPSPLEEAPEAPQVPEVIEAWESAVAEAHEMDKAEESAAAVAELASAPVSPASEALLEASAPALVAEPESTAGSAAVAETSEPAPVVERAEIAPERPVSDPEKTHPSLKPLEQSADETARSITKQDWADLTGSLPPQPVVSAEEKTESDAAPAVAASELPPTEASPVPAAASAGSEPAIAEPEIPAARPVDASAEDTARSISKRDWAELAASLNPNRAAGSVERIAIPHVAEESAGPGAHSDAFTALASIAQGAVGEVQPESSSSEPSAPPDPVLVEAVVQRILEKWRPQVVDIITKEFLRPIVQALVQREILKR